MFIGDLQNFLCTNFFSLSEHPPTQACLAAIELQGRSVEESVPLLGMATGRVA
jgi:hypothetical protein